MSLEKSLRHQVGQAVADYQMIQAGDRILVALSGGKDSYALLDFLRHLQKVAPIDFELLAVNLDQKQPGFPEEVLPNYLEKIGVKFQIIERDTYSIVKEKTPEGKTFCGLCSRLRRGILYNFATENGCNKIALGHHMDDIVETFFMNMFFNSRLKAMPPKLLSDDKRNIVIRPLAYCREKDLSIWAATQDYPIIPCNLCGSQENLQRKKMKHLLSEWEKTDPGRTERIFRSLQNISPSQMADNDLFAFHHLEESQILQDPTAPRTSL